MSVRMLFQIILHAVIQGTPFQHNDLGEGTIQPVAVVNYVKGTERSRWMQSADKLPNLSCRRLPDV